MPYEIINSIRSPSIIRVEGTGTTTVQLANLSFDVNETVNFANIKRINWSTNGNISITRNNVSILTLHNTGELRCDEFGFSIANNNTSNVAITITTGGSIIMEMSKDCSYTTALIG